MAILIQIFVISYTFFTAWCMLGTWRFLKKSPKKNNLSNISLNDLCVIIPFRNEEYRIRPLLNCIQNYFPSSVELIFVDDHSDDNSCEIIRSALSNVTIIKNANIGKKQALSTAIKHTNREWILTWDADICFSENYFIHLEQLQHSDLIILPVQFKGNYIQIFIQLDTELAQITNYAQAGFGLPILASGANLLFRKQTYLQKHSLESHQHISSGDDQFLLQAIKKNGGTIQLISNQQLAITTPCESGGKKIIYQRLRWLTKTPLIKDKTANTIVLIQFTLHVFWATLLIIALLEKNAAFVISLYFSKTFLDFLICGRYFIQRKEVFQLLYLPLFELYFPIYSIFLALSTFFIRPQWKKRTLKI